MERRRRASPLLLLVSVILVASVVVAAATPRLTIKRMADPAQLAEIVRLAGDADVVGIGEAHDNPAHHAAQHQILEALVAAGARPVVAFEMLTVSQQTTVDSAMAEALDAAELDRRLTWRVRGWPDFAMYYPMFALAHRHGLPVLAADLDADRVRSVARRGLDSLAPEDRAPLRSRLPMNEGREGDLRRELHAAHCGAIPTTAITTMAEAWHARNVTMADRLAMRLPLPLASGAAPVAPARGPLAVLITGRGHLASDAVPGQMTALRPGARMLIVDLVEDAITPLANADVVWTTPSMIRPDPCARFRERLPGGS